MALIDPALLKALLGSAAGRFDVDALDDCDSTSSELARRAERGAPAGSVVVADRQHAGRGRRGRSWLSAPAASLTFSLLWRFTGNPAQLAGLSLAVGVALVEALEKLGATGIRLKWPNDLLHENNGHYAKLAGILIELYPDRRGTQAIIGIGLNLAAPGGEIDQPAAGLDQAMPDLPERHRLFATLLASLADRLDAFAATGFGGCRAAWLARHAWQDAPVLLSGDGGAPRSGRCLGADDDGALLLAGDNGIERIFSGDVSLRRA